MQKTLFSQFFGSHISRSPPSKNSSAPPERQIAFLAQEVKHLKKVLSEEMQLEAEIKQAFLQGTFQNKKNAYRFLLEKKLESLPARVLFLFPSRFSRAFWIDVGEETNRALGKSIVAVGSPVIVGNTLVGIVEILGSKESRVKHVRDPSFVVAAQSQRGERFLTKGILEGSFDDGLLTGVGFNADFEDAFSEKRDLRTGKKERALDDLSTVLLASKDRLITSGLDGLFPRGIDIGEVVRVSGLREGDVAYHLVAKSYAPFEELETVFVLPPLLNRLSENGEGA